MYLRSKVTQKGQVTIPKKLRDHLKIKPYSTVVFLLDEKRHEAKILPSVDILDIAGTFKPRKNAHVDVLKAREYMETHYERA